MQMWVATIKLLFLEKKHEEGAQVALAQGARTFLTIGFVHPAGTRVELLVSRDRTATIL